MPAIDETVIKGAINRMNRIKDSIDELKRNSDRFHVAAAVTGSLIYEWDLESGRIKWIGDVEEIFGIPMEQLPESVSGLVEFIHPGDRLRIVEEIEKERKGGFSRSFDCRIRNKRDSEWRIWNLCIVTVEAQAGILKKIYGICRSPRDKEEPAGEIADSS
ncbi:MAG: PAS domain-containing protein [Candidatus Latescibacteria bacterium]|nr:PAS domain-containing protein [bacterium]MBD3424305.1 PAS domain-containing protein [Candidatus Latescibacterota bacterium]